MKSVFIAGSKKFHDDIEKLVQQLKDNKIIVATADKYVDSRKDTLENQKEALLNAFQKIDEFDICYVYSKYGYIGKTVAMEIAYAYVRKKELISLDKIEELSAQALIFKVMNPEELIKHCKNVSSG